MKKILTALVLIASVTAASAQTQPAQKKSEAKKECCRAQAETCGAKKEKTDCCVPSGKGGATSSKKTVLKKS